MTRAREKDDVVVSFTASLHLSEIKPPRCSLELDIRTMLMCTVPAEVAQARAVVCVHGEDGHFVPGVRMGKRAEACAGTNSWLVGVVSKERPRSWPPSCLSNKFFSPPGDSKSKKQERERQRKQEEKD